MLPGVRQEHARPAFRIGQRVQLRLPAAARAAIACGPPFPPPAERCALTCVLSLDAVPIMPEDSVRVRKIANQRPCLLQLLKRLWIVVHMLHSEPAAGLPRSLRALYDGPLLPRGARVHDRCSTDSRGAVRYFCRLPSQGAAPRRGLFQRFGVQLWREMINLLVNSRLQSRAKC
jgi:hypothetical protein